MISFNKLSFTGLLAGVVLACAIGQPAMAAQVAGIKFDDTVKVAGQELTLNGLGMRTKFFIKVYAAGLYLPKKTRAVAEVMKMDGARRMTLVMTRDISSEDFGQAFMNGINDNLNSAEKVKIFSQISKFGEMFALIENIKKGDVLNIDWIPGSGTQCKLNGKNIGELVPELDFYNAVLRIWLGDKPADRSLKPALLGEVK